MSTTVSRSTSSSPPKNRPWHLGNTTVRSPFRLADALRVLAASRYNGNWSDPDTEAAVCELLHGEGLLKSVADGETRAWNGRKWRSAMYQLGFITPEIVRGLPAGQIDLRVQQAAAGLPGVSGRQYEVTPNGVRLAAAESVIQMEECFLRSLLAYRVPSPIESGTHDCEHFSPLRVVLRTMRALEAANLPGHVSFEEMASLVQFCKSESDVPRLASEIAAYREQRNASRNKRVFDEQFRRGERARHGDPVKMESLNDYADVNFRYLRATGLVTRGKASIVAATEKRRDIDLILEQPDTWPGDDAYLRRLWDGAPLPTDDAGEATTAIRALEDELRRGGVAAVVPLTDGMALPDLQQVRLRLESERRTLREETYALAQRNDIASIAELLALMQNKNERSAAYKSEAPAYLEWTFWRAFLAINTLANQPWEVRQFNVDAEMNPLSPASSRKPDMVCEFEDWILVVEVTFTENSRQEAAEGEPVRRHVAEVVQRHAHERPVFGLFVAPKIDTNTAETFGRGNFVLGGARVPVDIVPVTIGQFAAFFEAGFSRNGGLGPTEVRQLLEACTAVRTDDGEAWKTAIEGLLRDHLGPTAPTPAGGRV